ncbi:TetR/AcrR family transcriptional regulator [Cryomorphaceae bacterium]|nr:TetR/AcrR family transcriptional regulator [Cryomorphaceae bacterium]
MPRVKLFDEQQTLERAMNLFWKQGYSATSVQDLVDHLGINRASIYDTFGDKEQLFLKSFENYRKTNSAFIAQFFEDEPQVKQGFYKLFEMAVDQSLSDAEKKGCFVVNTTTELIPGDERISRILEENRISFEQLFEEYLQKGVSQGQIPEGKDLKATASLLFTYYSGLRVVSKVNPSKSDLMNSVKVILSVLD